MDQTQRAQRFDQVQLARIEFEEVFITGQNVAHLPHLVGALSGQHHPQILHRRTHAAVVEIDEVRPVVGPQHIAAMAIAVQADQIDIAGALVAVAHADQRLVDHAAISRFEVGRYPVVR